MDPYRAFLPPSSGADPRESLVQRVSKCMTFADVRHYYGGQPGGSTFGLISNRTAAMLRPSEQAPVETKSKTLTQEPSQGCDTLPPDVVLICTLNDVLFRILQFAGSFVTQSSPLVPISLTNTGIRILFGQSVLHLTVCCFASYTEIGGRPGRGIDPDYIYWVNPLKSGARSTFKLSELYFYRSRRLVVIRTGIGDKVLSSETRTDQPPPELRDEYEKIHQQTVITAFKTTQKVLQQVFPRRKQRSERGRQLIISTDSVVIAGRTGEAGGGMECVTFLVNHTPSAEYSFVTPPVNSGNTSGVLNGKILVDMIVQYGSAIGLAKGLALVRVYAKRDTYYWLSIECHFDTEDSYGEVCVAVSDLGAADSMLSPSPMPLEPAPADAATPGADAAENSETSNEQPSDNADAPTPPTPVDAAASTWLMGEVAASATEAPSAEPLDGRAPADDYDPDEYSDPDVDEDAVVFEGAP